MGIVEKAFLCGVASFGEPLQKGEAGLANPHCNAQLQGPCRESPGQDLW
jgi:hypothetical protein